VAHAQEALDRGGVRAPALALCMHVCCIVYVCVWLIICVNVIGGCDLYVRLVCVCV
jgi:hypothetical protein